MYRVNRLRFSLGVASSLAVVPLMQFPGEAAEFTYKLGTESLGSSPAVIRMLQAAASIGRDSHGRMEVQVFPNGSLGGGASALTQLREGAIELYPAPDIQVASMVPIAGITGVPFAFQTAADGTRTMNGPLGKLKRAGLESLGLHVFDFWSTGLRQLSNSARPINAAADLRGLKIRVPNAPVVVSLFKSLGASPTTTSYAEIYTSLKTHLCDGCETEFSQVDDLKLYEVQKYGTYTNHLWTVSTFVANAAAWQRLPKDLQNIVARYLNQAAKDITTDYGSIGPAVEKRLTEKGMSFTRPNVATFRELVRQSGLYGQLRDTYGAEAWDLLEKSVGKLT